MSLSPTIGISKLSLESMPPTTRSNQEMDPSRQEDTSRQPHGEADESAEEDNGSTIRSPTRLKYDIGRLSPRTQKLVRSLWGDTFEEPPEISLQWCDRMLDAEGNVDFYAFQMHEVVPRSVRIGSPNSQYSEPQCQCGAAKPCKHLIWLSDFIAQQALYDHNPQEPLNMNEQGYPEELGEPFQCISDMHLDVLADGLNCEIGHPLARSGPSPQRVAEAQSIIASIADVDERVFDSYRSDLADASSFDPRSPVHHKDAEATLFSLLVASHRLSAWLRSRLRPSDPARSPFRQIESRARRILSDFDTFPTSSPSPGQDAEGACDVPWAARGLTRCARQIHTLVSHPEAPLSPAERGNAARALVRILRGVVDRHPHHHHHQTGNAQEGGEDSLYARLLIGHHQRDNEGFAADALGLLVDQSQFVDEIEDIMAEVGRRGAAAPWVAKMEAVVARMRGNRRRASARHAPPPPPPPGVAGAPSTAAAAAAAGRAGQQQRRRQREVSPALGPVEHGEPGSASASGVGIGASGGTTAVGLGIGYGTGSAVSGSSGSASTAGSGAPFGGPGMPAGPSSSRGRGSGRASRGASSGGAGSKRSGAGTGSERGSKRAR